MFNYIHMKKEEKLTLHWPMPYGSSPAFRSNVNQQPRAKNTLKRGKKRTMKTQKSHES